MQLALRWMSKFSPLVTRTVLLRRNKIWSLHQKIFEQAFSTPSLSAIVLARLSNKFASGWHAGCRWGIPRIHVLDAAPDEAKATRPWAVSAATQSFRNLQDLFQIEVWLKKLFTQHCSSSLARVGLGARNSPRIEVRTWVQLQSLSPADLLPNPTPNVSRCQRTCNVNIAVGFISALIVATHRPG